MCLEIVHLNIIQAEEENRCLFQAQHNRDRLVLFQEMNPCQANFLVLWDTPTNHPEQANLEFEEYYRSLLTQNLSRPCRLFLKYLEQGPTDNCHDLPP